MIGTSNERNNKVRDMIYTIDGFVHILLIIAIVMIPLRIISGRKPFYPWTEASQLHCLWLESSWLYGVSAPRNRSLPMSPDSSLVHPRKRRFGCWSLESWQLSLGCLAPFEGEREIEVELAWCRLTPRLIQQPLCRSILSICPFILTITNGVHEFFNWLLYSFLAIFLI